MVLRAMLKILGSTNEEEKGKGKTVEVGRAHFEPETTRFTILDAWGHKNYVPNMISGASQVDIGMLVIYAQKVKFETGGERSGNEGFFVTRKVNTITDWPQGFLSRTNAPILIYTFIFSIPIISTVEPASSPHSSTLHIPLTTLDAPCTHYQLFIPPSYS
ncbi:unnamed protein product, partial [Vitis vinifera]